MTDFNTGDICYTPDGVQCQYHHTYDGKAYVRKGFIVESPETEYDFLSAYVDYSDDLTSVNPTQLLKKAPVEAFSDEVTKLLNQKRNFQADIESLKTDVRAVKTSLREAVAESEGIMKQYPMFPMIHDLINGVPYVGLQYFDSTTCVPVAYGCSTNGHLNFDVLTLVKTSKGWKWRGDNTRNHNTGGGQMLALFKTEDEMRDKVSELWELVLNRWKIHPNRYGDTPHTSRNFPNMRTLATWVKYWPHLSIPTWVIEEKATQVNKEKDAELRKAREHVAALESGETPL